MHIADGGHLFIFVNVLQSEAWLGNNITHAPSAHLALELDSKTWNSSNIRMHPPAQTWHIEGRFAAGRNCNGTSNRVSFLAPANET